VGTPKGLAAGHGRPLYALRTLAEHGDQIALPLVPCNDEDVGAEAAAAPVAST